MTTTTKLSGQFLLGLPYKDKTHYDFKVRILTMGGECMALEVIEECKIPLDSTKKADQTLIDLAYLAQQIEVDGIPSQALTPQFLLDNLATDDYLLVTDLIGELRKKRIEDGGHPLPTQQ